MGYTETIEQTSSRNQEWRQSIKHDNIRTVDELLDALESRKKITKDFRSLADESK